MATHGRRYVHTDLLNRLLLTFYYHYYYCAYLPAPNLLLPECMHTQSGSFKVYHFSAWYGVIFVVAAAFHVAVAPFLFSYAKAPLVPITLTLTRTLTLTLTLTLPLTLPHNPYRQLHGRATYRDARGRGGRAGKPQPYP